MPPGAYRAAAYPRLKPIDKANDVRVLQALQEVELVVHHALVALDVLLQDNLDGHLAVRGVGLPNDAIGAGTEGATESVLCSSGLVVRHLWQTKALSLGRVGERREGFTYFFS